MSLSPFYLHTPSSSPPLLTESRTSSPLSFPTLLSFQQSPRNTEGLFSFFFFTSVSAKAAFLPVHPFLRLKKLQDIIHVVSASTLYLFLSAGGACGDVTASIELTSQFPLFTVNELVTQSSRRFFGVKWAPTLARNLPLMLITLNLQPILLGSAKNMPLFKVISGFFPPFFY